MKPDFSKASNSFKEANPQIFAVQEFEAAFPPEPEEPTRVEAKLEKELHNQIIQYCNLHEILFFHGRMDKKTGRTVGENDFTCLLPLGRILFVECKTQTGKLSNAQAELSEKMKPRILVNR